MKPHPMDCSEVRERLPLLPGGELEAPLAEAVEAHLGSCANCSRELERLRAALASLAGLGSRDDRPIDLWPALRGQLLTEGLIHAPRPVPAAAPARRTGTRSLWAWTAVAAAAAVLAWVGWDRIASDAGGQGGPRSVEPRAPELVVDRTPSRNGVQPVVSPIEVDPGVVAQGEGDLGQGEFAPGEPGAQRSRLRRADGEDRLREFAVPYEWVHDRGGAWSLAGDRELR